MKKLLLITAFPPNEMTAGQNYTRQLIANMSKIYDIKIICFNYKDHPIKLPPGVEILKKVKTSLFTKICSILLFPLFHPFFTSRFNLSSLKLIKKEAVEADLIYFDFSQVFIYSLFIKHPNKWLMAHDVIYQKYDRVYKGISRILLVWLFKTEGWILRGDKNLVVFSDKDKKLLKEIYNLESRKVDFFVSEGIVEASYCGIHLEDYFCFFSAWNRKENYEGLVWFINQIFPKVEPQLRFLIIGPGLPDTIKSEISKHSSIVYLGFLPDPYQIIMRSKALIAPIFNGAGVKVKVVEALSLGVPVVGTEMAFEGIEYDVVGENTFVFKDEGSLCSLLNHFPEQILQKRQDLKVVFNRSYSKNNFMNFIN